VSDAIRASTAGTDLARVLANAGAFVPARADLKMLCLRIKADTIEASGTDGYAAGNDSIPAHVTGGTVSFALTSESMTALEQAARAVKKDPVTLQVGETDVTLMWAVKGTPDSLTVEMQPYPWQDWGALEEMLNRPVTEERPQFVAFDPALFSRFAKVRAENDRVMDLWFHSAELPVLVKIGATFRGLVMPLQRARAAEYAPEGLW